MSKDTRATIAGARILWIAPDGSKAEFDIPGAGTRRIHQSGVHDDSEVWWQTNDGVNKGEMGPGKLILHGWYAQKIGIKLD